MTEKEFISDWINRLSSEGLKNFPEDFKEIKIYEEITLPQKSLLIGMELFGKTEIITSDGTYVLQADDYSQAKYIVYAARNRNCRIKYPKSMDEVRSLLSEYEKYLDSILVRINTEHKNIFKEKNSDFAANEIFRALNLIRY